MKIASGLKDFINRRCYIEKIKIHSLSEDYILSNPICKCGHRMKSAGKNKGFKYENFGTDS